MVQVKKTPLRKCTGCQEMKPKKELFRVVKTKENEIVIDFTNKKAGRGAYVCYSLDCLKKARKSRGLERAFSCRISEEIYNGLELALKSQETTVQNQTDSTGGANG